MQQKVDPSRVLELAAGLKRLSGSIGTQASGLCQEIKSVTRGARDDYPAEASIQRAADSVEEILRSIDSLSRDIIKRLEEKNSMLQWTAEKYRQIEQESAKKLKAAETRLDVRKLFTSLMQAASKNVGEDPKSQSKFSSFVTKLTGLLLELKEMALLQMLSPYQKDAKIQGLMNTFRDGTTEEQTKARKELEKVALAFYKIARNQVAYGVYHTYGHSEYMKEVSLQADREREVLRGMGISEQWYNKEVDLTSQYKEPILSSLPYNPLKHDKSPMPVDQELLDVIERGLEDEKYREYAKVHYPEIEEQVNQARMTEQMLERAKHRPHGIFRPAPVVEEKSFGENVENFFISGWESIKGFGESTVEAGSQFIQHPIKTTGQVAYNLTVGTAQEIVDETAFVWNYAWDNGDAREQFDQEVQAEYDKYQREGWGAYSGQFAADAVINAIERKIKISKAKNSHGISEKHSGPEVEPRKRAVESEGRGKGVNGVTNLLDKMPEFTGSTREKLLSAVQNGDLRKIVNELYRPGATVGDGGTASILTKEFYEGSSMHLQKAKDRVKQLNALARSKKLGLNDLDILDALTDDLENAIRLFK